jgi:hypothetical protein
MPRSLLLPEQPLLRGRALEFALAFLCASLCASAGVVTSSVNCAVSNNGSGVSLSAAGTSSCSLNTPSGGGFSDTHASASVGPGVSVAIQGFAPIGCCIFSYTTAASASAFVEDVESVAATSGPIRPGFVDVFGSLNAFLGGIPAGPNSATFSIGSATETAFPRVFSGSCAVRATFFHCPVELGQSYLLTESASASGSSDPSFVGFASANVGALEFFEADGVTPVAQVPEPSTGMLTLITLFGVVLRKRLHVAG